MLHKRPEDPTIDKWKCRAYILASVWPLLSLSASFLPYLAPPWSCMSISPTWASQLTLVTDRRPSASFPSSTTEVTSTLNIAMLNDPLSCLKRHKIKTCSAQWCCWTFIHVTYTSKATATLCQQTLITCLSYNLLYITYLNADRKNKHCSTETESLFFILLIK